MELINKGLPIWIQRLEGDDPSERLDNNWYSPAAVLAEKEMRKAARSGRFTVIALEALCEADGIDTGGSPDDEGTVGLIEGRNLRPNYIIPLFMKFGIEAMKVECGDLLMGKDGEPGTVAMITEDLLHYCQRLTIGGHVYHIRLAERYRELAPYISVFLNSRNGQALIRKQIAGGTTPTIRKPDVGRILILIPTDGKCPADIRDAVFTTQRSIIQAMDNLGPSKTIAEQIGMADVDVRLPTNWVGGGAQHSSRIVS